jgi:hypothetical protein
MRPPRSLYCEFPFGRPLGKPGDAAFQHRVLAAAFALLERPAGPVLEDFPERIDDESAQPLACVLPPRHDPDAPAAVDEARSLRPAYERQLQASGRTGVGRTVDADAVPDAVAAMLRLASGTPLDEACLPGPVEGVAHDISAYYEEAAIALAEHTPGARQAESWFYHRTETGAVLQRAQTVLREAGAPPNVWRSLVPDTQRVN